jgi:hypothetical protein
MSNAAQTNKSYNTRFSVHIWLIILKKKKKNYNNNNLMTGYGKRNEA